MVEGNLIIRASAGTGKTYSLATRYIRLMLFDDVNPAHIVALTFSRAAAQEIYTKILERLWKAAASDEGAKEERKELLKGLEDKLGEIGTKKIDWSSAGFARLLRQVIDAQHMGAIATLDSFILRIVRHFPLEMGFQRAVAVLDEHGEEEAVEQAVRGILSSTGGANDFSEAFRAALKDAMPRILANKLDNMLSQEGWRKFILAHPESRNWTAESMAKELHLAEASGFSSSGELALYPFLASLGNSEAGKNLGKVVDYLASVKAGENPIPSKTTVAVEFAQAVARHPNDPYFIHIKKKKDGSKEEVRIDYPKEVFDAARKDLSKLADAFLRKQLDAVAAKLKLLSLIEAEYDATTRKAGKLTFSDFTGYSAAAERDSQRQLAIRNLEFRFDSVFDHWALDEFQDTSEVQWCCLKRLVESAAEPGGGRTVVAVGDLKQSIYTWRGGNDAPFKEMMGWGAFDAKLGYGRSEDMVTSYRYQKNICDFVNAIFGPENLRGGGILPPERSRAADRWLGADCWREHEPEKNADGTPKSNDYVKVVGVRAVTDVGLVLSGAKGFETLLPALESELSAVWNEHERVKSDETVGVLVRLNEEGAAAAQYLRSKGFPVVWEGMNAVSDVPVVKALVNLLRLADHPEDTFAWKFVNDLLPVRRILFPDKTEASLVSKLVASDLSRLDIARTLKNYCGRLCEDKYQLDDLSRMRLHELVRAAVDYERRDSADYGIDGFIRFLDSLARRENGDSPRVIRILTIHRSKGLTLDRVFVPIWESDDSSIVEPKKKTVVFGAGRSWVLPHVSSDIAQLNAAVAAVVEEQRDDRLLEALRTNYVAFTRARKALYVIQPTNDAGVGVHFRSLVANAKIVRDYWECNKPEAEDAGEEKATLVLFEQGVAPAFSEPKRKDMTARTWKHVSPAEPVRRRSPSEETPVEKDAGTSFFNASSLFNADFGAQARHGTDEHAAFAEIERIDPSAPRDDREREILARDSTWREAFVLPAEATVWRERSYEIFDQKKKEWETGQFDRVVFHVKDGVRTADIYDFKTNRLRGSEAVEAFERRMRETYASQMAAYRSAISRLCGIQPENIASTLLLTATGTAVKVE